MNFELTPFHRNIPTDDLIEDVKSVANKLNRDTITMEEYRINGKYHPTTLTRRLGSWPDVLSMANLKPSRSQINIPNEDLFENLCNVWIKLSRQPRYTDMQQPLSTYSASTYEKRFGTWNKALEQFIIYINENNHINHHTVHNVKPKQNEHSTHIYKHKTRNYISPRLRFTVLLRDGFTCKTCGRSPLKDNTVTLHIDHIIPWSKGGETVLENLETKCDKCNCGKGNAFNV